MKASSTANPGGATAVRVRFSRRVVEVEGAEVSLMVGPSTGRSMLLVHGLAARWQVFGSLIPRWSPDWRVLALDLPGHGSSARARHLYSVRGYAAAVVAALDDAREPAIVVGHSAGGWAALQAAATQPERVAALVLVDTPIDVGRLDRGAAAAEVAAAPVTLRSLSPSLTEVDPCVLEALRSGELLAGYRPRRLLPHVQCPVLLLQASPACGGLMSDADVRTARALGRNVHHVRIDSAGHALPVQAPATVDTAVREFLAATGACPGRTGSS